jgi:epoxyqueuosine reductase
MVPRSRSRQRDAERAAGLGAPELAELAERTLAIGREQGLAAVGIARAEHFVDVQRALEDRKAAGISAEMGFTYRNPARSSDPTQALPGAASLIVAARRYRRADVDEPSATVGRIARYAWVDHYQPLRDALNAMGAELRDAGFRTRVLVDDNTLVDRAAAYRAGLGWFGKNANLLLPGQGSWFVLGSLITNAVFEPSPAPVADGCGSCVRCIDGCPTAAIVQPGVVDARRCLAWLVQRPGVFPMEFREALGDRIYGCDDCQEVCPPNRTYDRRVEPMEPEPNAQPFVELVKLVTDSDEQLLTTYGRFYIPNRDANVLRRNALLAIGNRLAAADLTQADDQLADNKRTDNKRTDNKRTDHSFTYDVKPLSETQRTKAIRCLVGALRHESPIVRGAAVWALGRAGASEYCVPRLTEEQDPQVREELERVLR